MKLDYTREDWNTTDYRWLGSAHGTNSTKGVMLDISHAAWVEASHFPDGYLLAGILLVESATPGMWVPYRQGVDPADPGTVFTLYNGGQRVVDPATDPNPSVAILVHGQIRAQFLPTPAVAITDYSVLGSQLTLTPAA